MAKESSTTLATRRARYHRNKKLKPPKPSLYGSVNYTQRSLLERFEEKVMPIPPSTCWIWIGGTATNGYGVIWSEGKLRPAHRVAWELHHGQAMPAHLDACHTCDNGYCVNPLHIWPGTTAQNIQDAVAKGRWDTVTKAGTRNIKAFNISAGRLGK